MPESLADERYMAFGEVAGVRDVALMLDADARLVVLHQPACQAMFFSSTDEPTSRNGN
jgi:hypothetical protein